MTAESKSVMDKQRAYDIVNCIGGICATKEEVKKAYKVLNNTHEGSGQR